MSFFLRTMMIPFVFFIKKRYEEVFINMVFVLHVMDGNGTARDRLLLGMDER